MKEWVARHKFAVILAGIIVIALATDNLDAEKDALLGFATETTTGATPVTTTARSVATTGGSVSADRPEIPPLSCNTLIEITDVDLALGSEDRPFSQLSSFRMDQGETCLETLASDDAYYIKLEPGDPADFTPGASLNGVTAAAVPDVGNEARWFGGDGVPALLSVYAETAVGDLVFRVSIGRPDLEPDEQLAVVTELARAILPRFPYVEIEKPEPVLVEFEPDPVEPGPQLFDDLVVAGEEAGDWTHGEGLVAALRFLAGEASDFEPQTGMDVTSGSGSGLMLMATNYVETGPDDEARAEIERLLGQLEFPQAPDVPSTTEAAGDYEETVLAFQPQGETAALQEEEPAEQTDGLSCGLDPVWYDIDCMEVEDLGGVLFGYPRGALEGTVEGWDADDVAVIRGALQTAVAEYSKHGTLTQVDVMLTPLGGTLGEGVPQKEGDRCVVTLRKALQNISADGQRFVTGMELAGCFLYRNLPKEVFRSYPAAKWWYQGTVVYLAAEAFPDINGEWQGPIPRLQATELATSLQDRSVENWPFFRSVATHGGGPNAVLDMIGALTDAPSKEAQQDRLAAYNPSNSALYVFHEELTDSNIPDPTPPPSEYSPDAWEVALTGPTTIAENPTRFGVSRYEVTVATGLTACLEYDVTDDVLTAWRQGAPGSPGGGWTFDTPSEITGESVFVLTTVAENQSFQVTADVSEEPDCEEDDDPAAIELPDCGICDPSLFYRIPGAVRDAMGA